MKRDMELIRDILLQIQRKEDLRPGSIEVEGCDPIILGRHLEMLYDAGFVEGIKSQQIGPEVPSIRITDLSWDGHDFIATLENKSVWGKMKQKFSADELATLPLGVIKAVGSELLLAYAKAKVGI